MMVRKDLLICGHRSFVATGLINKLKGENLSFDTFSRGKEYRADENISGDVLRLSENKFLIEYNTIINYIKLYT